MSSSSDSYAYLYKELQFKGTHSRGPGGQNVNKVQTAMVLFWPYQSSKLLTPEEKIKVQTRLAGYINRDNELVLRSDQFRSQKQNQKACLLKFFRLLKRALKKEKKRIPTKPTLASKQKKRKNQKRQSERKEMRKKVDYENL